MRKLVDKKNTRIGGIIKYEKIVSLLTKEVLGKRSVVLEKCG